MRKALLIVSLVFLSGCGPSDYDECILENMKGINDENAAGLVMQSCMDKFPVKQVAVEKCPLRNMTMDELSLLEVNAKTSWGDWLSLSVYNHNEISELHELTVLVTAPNYRLSQQYTKPTFVGPRSGENSILISVAETPKAPWGLMVLAAKTCSK